MQKERKIDSFGKLKKLFTNAMTNNNSNSGGTNNQSLKSEKNYSTAVILSGIFGIVGIHHFYVGRWGMGVLDFSLFLVFALLYYNNCFLYAGIVFILDLVHTIVVTYLLLVGKYNDGQGKRITYPGQKI